MQLETSRVEDTPRAAELAMIGRASAYASAIGAKVIARIHRPSPVADPWDAWTHDGDVQAAWSSGSRRLLALGSLAPDEEPLEAALAPGGVSWIDPRPELPAAIGAFAFAAEAEPWPGFGRGRRIVPRVMLWREGERSGAAYALEIAPGQGIASILAQIAKVQRVLNNRILPHGVGLVAAEPPQAAWLDLAERARADIGRGALAKVVLARSRELRAKGGFDPASTLEALAARDGDAHAFAVRGAAGGWWLGVSPELLASVRGRELATVALAGTRPRGATARADEALALELMASEKDAREHRVVLDAILARLAPLCRTIERSPAPRVARTARLMHLETPVRGALRGPTSVLDVVRALHPTPAVAGAPRELALDWIAREERLARGWYAGPVGWLDARGGGEFAVGLRALRLEGDRATAYAGAGIVEGSEPADEWAEISHKLAVAISGLTARVSA